MKIAVVGTRGFPRVQGGVEKHCEMLYPRLVKLGCDVTVYTRTPYVDKFNDNFEGMRLIPINCPRSKNFEAIIHTFQAILKARELKPDILHIHGIGPALLVWLARISGMRVVMTHHGQDYRRKKWGVFGRIALRLGEIAGVFFSGAIICVAKNTADDIFKRFGRAAVYIPNGIDIPDIAATDEILKRHSLEKNRYILFVGRFVREKGLDDLIKAFAAAGPRGWKLVMAGGPDHEDGYSRSLVSMAGDTDDVILTGFVSGRPLEELYSGAGLFVLPSHYEGLPIVLLEAMSYGLPCIASDIPANMALELQSECYYRAGDVKALAEKISDFVKRKIPAVDAAAVRARLKLLYNWDDIAAKTYSVYKEIRKLGTDTYFKG